MTSPKGQRTSDYEYDLPERLIAQQPAADRTSSRLMVVRRATGAIEHRHFGDLPALMASGDVLALNTTRVIKARLLGTRASGARAEILLLRPVGELRWEAMVSPGGKLKPGRMIQVGDDLRVEILEVTKRRTRVVRLESALPDHEAIERYGHVPLPPYIGRPDESVDAERYQTVYARQGGSVAAPTAGLHFTDDLLARLSEQGVRRAEVLLHVGAGTFKPVETDDPAHHVMHEESFIVPQRTVDEISAARDRGNHVWAVGTTTVRSLESAAAGGVLEPVSAETRLFIRPPYQFRIVDRLITNFHLPRSTLLMLVAAFAGYELIMRAYREAVEREYRFFSYGDAMAII